MRIAAIYDIHANLPALEAVLQEIREAHVALIVVGGDVFPGPMPYETLRCLLELDIPTQFIQGNGDREVFARMAGVETDWYRNAPQQWREPVEWTARQLYAERQRLVAGWLPTYRMNIPEMGETLFCHATPQNDTDIFTRLTPEHRLIPVFESANAQLAVCGHTHIQFDRRIGGVRVVNAGSVGMPFGEPGAYWLLLEPDVHLRYTSYDLANAVERICATAYPAAQDFALQNVLHPPSEADMLAIFHREERN